MSRKITTFAACTALAVPLLLTGPATADDIAPDPVVTDPTTPAPVEPEPVPLPTEPTQPTQAPTPVPSATATPTPTPVPVSKPTPQPAPVTPTSVPTTAPVQQITGDTMDPQRKKKKRTRVPDRASRGAVLRTRGTRFTATVAVHRLRTWAKQGRSGYRNQCLRLVDDAYGVRGGRTGTALRQWYRAQRVGYAHFDRYPPLGAQLFWRTRNPAGHIATYVGNGKVVTNVRNGKVRIRNWSTLDRWGPYLGWAEPFYG